MTLTNATGKPYQIAIAGFQHETNTFMATQAGVREFQVADSWPARLEGHAVIRETMGMNLPIAGAITRSAGTGLVELRPILWCAAEPSGYVSDEAYEQTASQIVDGVRNLPAVDAIYLDLHGAMVTSTFEDGEGELLKRLRGALGPEIPIGVSLDFHANVTQQMVDCATVITIYRTYPHLDMADCGSRCMGLLLQSLTGTEFFPAFLQSPYLVPLHAQSTHLSPCNELYQHLENMTDSDTESLDMAMGFTAADIYDCGPSVLAYAQTRNRAVALANCLLCELEASELLFNSELVEPDEAVKCAIEAGASDRVVLADVQDNPGAGGTSDTTGILTALLNFNARRAVLGVLCDQTIAALAHTSGEGSVIEAPLGARDGNRWGEPVIVPFRVRKLSAGNVEYTGAMYRGAVATLGPSCLLQTIGEADIQIVVSSQRIQCLDQALFTHFGVDLLIAKIIVVKSTVHYLADFESLAGTIINVCSPGGFSCRLDEVTYRRLRRGVRLGPGGEPH